MILPRSDWLASGSRSEANGTAFAHQESEYIRCYKLSPEHKSLANLRRAPSRAEKEPADEHLFSA